MKRLFGYCGLRASAWAASPKLHLALMLSCLLSPVAFGQEGGLSGPGGAPKSSHGAISDAVKAAAFRERCVLLSTKFKHQGVDFQSKSGIGCIISTPQGQRILAMPFSMTMPVEVVQGNEKRSVACSMLLASKLGNTDTFQESLASFTERVDEFPMESLPKPAKKEPLLESERRIYQALDERGEVNFNGTPLSGVMKFFRERYSVPIVIVDKSLEFESVAPDEPVTIELPEVSFRSALNLILKPYNLTFVVENEVLRITSYEEAGKGDDPIRHWDPKGPVLETERKIFRALSERGEVNFIGTPLSDVMKIFRNAYWIPIVLDEKNLEMENITSDEPITLELPVLSFRSALNLILEPLGLTYVIENEVLLITSKAIALAEHPAPFSSANPKGVIAIGTRFVGGLGGMGGGGMGGQPGLYFNFTPTQRYRSLQEAQKANADAGFPAGLMTTGNGSQRQEYSAIHGPLAYSVDKTLGVVFVSLPGDFQAVPIPARVKAAGKRFVMLGQSWIEITQDRDSLAAVINGSPVIDQQGEPIGMFLDQKVVSLPELVQSLLSIDSTRLGYWGVETKVKEQEDDPFAGPVSTDSNDKLPELVTPELKKQVERVASLKGEGKVLAQRAIHAELEKRLQLRKKAVEEKLKSVQSNLERLKQLSAQMNKQDEESMLKLLLFLDGNPPPSHGNSDDPFK